MRTGGYSAAAISDDSSPQISVQKKAKRDLKVGTFVAIRRLSQVIIIQQEAGMTATQANAGNQVAARNTATSRSSQGAGTKGNWEHFRLNAGTGLRGWGKNIEEAFEEAGRSLTALFTAPEMVQPSELFEFSCGAPNEEELLVEFLNLLIYSIRAKRMFFSHF